MSKPLSVSRAIALAAFSSLALGPADKTLHWPTIYNMCNDMQHLVYLRRVREFINGGCCCWGYWGDYFQQSLCLLLLVCCKPMWANMRKKWLVSKITGSQREGREGWGWGVYRLRLQKMRTRRHQFSISSGIFVTFKSWLHLFLSSKVCSRSEFFCTSLKHFSLSSA